MLIGKMTSCDLFNDKGLLIIPQGTVLTQLHLNLAENHGINIEPHHVMDLEQPELPAVEPASCEQLVSKATEEMKHIFWRFRTSDTPSVNELMTNLVPQIQESAGTVSLFALLSSLEAKDDYTYRHNIGVAAISTMIGKWMKMDKESLRILTLAAAMHDIGKVKIHEDILNKPGKYSAKEYEIMKRHTIYGYEILSEFDDELPPQVKLAALQHHERMDGQGYPHGITGDQMDLFSKIVAVADVFHAMSTKRIYREEIPLYQVLEDMKRMAFGKMDPAITNLFIHRMMECAIGSEVLLSNHQTGKITFVFQEDPLRPLIRVKNEYIDLRKQSDVKIQKLVG